MIARFALVLLVPLALGVVGTAHAQDVPGIEICTVEKTMERRTSCLQSNVDFLQKTISKLTTDHQQKLVTDLQAVQLKLTEDLKKKADAPPAKDAAPAAKDGTK